ncbi:MAG: hypothetical protein OQK95_03170 [Gammaproteobacteria bacterium]|nr:hypothetical protein [Gammaproteobacteria bacterium]
MGRLLLKSIGDFGKSPNTESEYDNQATEERIGSVLERITAVLNSKGNEKACYIFGMGAQPKSVYNNLKAVDGVEVIWSGSLLPKVIRFMGGIVASHAGLVKITNPDMITDTFDKLTELSMAGIYLFSPDFESKFVKEVISNPAPFSYDFIIKEDKGYFLYVVDADNPESETGIYEIVSYGKSAPESLKI